MSHWTFVVAAYAITLAGTAVLLAVSWSSMRRSEGEADALRREP